MKTIYKYQLIEMGQQVIKLPSGFKILSIQQQDGELTLWAYVDTNAHEVEATINIYETGRTIPTINQRYLATVQMDNGLVWHVFIVD